MYYGSSFIWISCFVLLIDSSTCFGRQESYTAKDIIDHSIEDGPTALTAEDFEAIDDGFEEQNLTDILEPDQQHKLEGDPILRANLYQGDIDLSGPEDENALKPEKHSSKKHQIARSAVSYSRMIWPGGKIPYVLSRKYGVYSRRVIAKAMKRFKDETCIRFVPRTRERNYVYIYPDSGCYSIVGRVGGRQIVSLDEGCIDTGTVQHELMHASGFYHEQSRPDRDDWIEIVKKNINPDALDQFEKYSRYEMNTLGVEYDYGSIMHYGPYAFTKYPFSRNGKTIKAKKPGGDKMGQREGFSEKDVKKINTLYKCSKDDIELNRKTPLEEISIPSGNGPDSSGQCYDADGFMCSVKVMFWGCSDLAVQDSCRRRCNLCETATGTEIETRPEKPTSSRKSSCRDRSQSCFIKAHLNFCNRYESYMRDRCPAICGFCEEDEDRSKPIDSSGENTKSGGKESGNTSSGSTGANKGGTNNCIDKSSHCTDWLTKNPKRCNQFSKYMGRMCRKSCNLC